MGPKAFVSKDVDAERYRGLRMGDPCGHSAVFRRVTLDQETREVIADDRCAAGGAAADFRWRTLLPGGPRHIETRLHYRDAEGSHEQLAEIPALAVGHQPLGVPT